MNTRRFFIDPGRGPADTTVSITGDEYHHLKQVNRAHPGEKIEAIDGRGALFFGQIREFKNNCAIIDVIKKTVREKPPLKLILAPSLIKQRSMNILIEKCSEMGVDEIHPLIFQRTDEKHNPSRLDKWQKIALQSLKVNKRLWQTDIFQPVKLDHWLTSGTVSGGTGILLDIAGEPGPDANHTTAPLPLIAVIGPPGEMTDEERKKLVQHGFTPCNISDAVLKTDTAAISIAAILKQFLNYREHQNRNAA